MEFRDDENPEPQSLPYLSWLRQHLSSKWTNFYYIFHSDTDLFLGNCRVLSEDFCSWTLESKTGKKRFLKTFLRLPCIVNLKVKRNLNCTMNAVFLFILSCPVILEVSRDHLPEWTITDASKKTAVCLLENLRNVDRGQVLSLITLPQRNQPL